MTLVENDRFNRDFAAIEKQQREAAHKARLDKIEAKRVEKYHRDMQRWEFMDEEVQRHQAKLAERAQSTRTNKGGAAFNIINMQYAPSQDGH